MIRENKTEFAPAGRLDNAAIAEQRRSIDDTQLFAQLYDAVNDMVLVLNQERQIVYANRNLASLLGAQDDAGFRGLRPGEAIGCTRACQSPGGCGTSKFCSACGAVHAILIGQEGRQDVQECRILLDKTGDALDLRVRATPLTLDGRNFTVCAVQDISHEKRRRSLERIFFHDVLNTAMGMRLMSEITNWDDPASRARTGRRFHLAVERLIEEVVSQRDLMAAESAELAVRPQSIQARQLLESAVESCRTSPAARDRHTRLADDSRDVPFSSDPTLLGRVLCNLIKNALEASPAGATVTVGVGPSGEGVEFRVHNCGVMPQDVQLQLFQRSFSTKGPGRGLGTYSVKLLTERFLGGRVSFESCPDCGTIFRAWYPIVAGE